MIHASNPLECFTVCPVGGSTDPVVAHFLREVKCLTVRLFDWNLISRLSKLMHLIEPNPILIWKRFNTCTFVIRDIVRLFFFFFFGHFRNCSFCSWLIMFNMSDLSNISGFHLIVWQRNIRIYCSSCWPSII